ncbi:MAG: CocE/NonD family hydrolase [Acidobacteriia bacterium]|nr:CocE/NonD family hydrolase [Terriglobia bacterium]
MIRRILLLIVAFSFATCGSTSAQQPDQKSAKTSPIKIYFGQKIRMRDGVELSADVYRPDTDGRFPCILNRTPYLKNSAGSLKFGRYFAEHGYVFVAMDVRGRGDSPGNFVPYRHEGKDGYDSVEWCATQPWSTGKVGTIGGSYNGKTQWLTAVEQPPHLTTMIAMVSPSDPFVEFPTGEPIPVDASWYYLTSGHVLQNMDAADWTELNWHLPLLTIDEAIGMAMPEWRELFNHTYFDSFWEAEQYQNKFDRVQVPVLHISGWYDDEQVGTPLNFIGMTTKGAPSVRNSQKLLMGPWPHGINSTSKLGDVDFGPTAIIDLNDTMLRWYDAWLKGIDNGVKSEAPVRIFVMGSNQWVNEHDWPMTRTRYTDFNLHSSGRANSLYGDGKLSADKPQSEQPDRYTYDPKKPVPFITEPSFAQIGGPDDYRPIERRDDVLVYTGDPVTNDTEVCGPVKVTLYAASTATDTDFTAKLIDVWPDGFAERLSDGIVRARFRKGMDKEELIQPETIYEYRIDAWNTCQMFKPGHRIRIEISSSAFPKYPRNLNTGGPLGRSSKMQTAQQTIYHDAQHPSHVTLPIVP